MIKQTQNYSMFKVLSGNRPTSKAHIKKLAEAIKTNNMLSVRPIIINENYEVIDGQNRLRAAELLNVPIYYTELSGSGLKEVQELNTNTKNWSMQDYLSSYILQGYDDYIILNDFVKKYDITLNIGTLVLSGDILHKNISDSFRQGQFKIKSLKKAEELITKLIELKPYLDKNVISHREFLVALDKVLQKVKFKRLFEKIRIWPYKMTRHVGTREYLRELEDIYNYKLHNKIRFFE